MKANSFRREDLIKSYHGHARRKIGLRNRKAKKWENNRIIEVRKVEMKMRMTNTRYTTTASRNAALFVV